MFALPLREGKGVAMTHRPHTFDPLDLEIIDRVYEAACARFEANATFAAQG